MGNWQVSGNMHVSFQQILPYVGLPHAIHKQEQGQRVSVAPLHGLQEMSANVLIFSKRLSGKSHPIRF